MARPSKLTARSDRLLLCVSGDANVPTRMTARAPRPPRRRRYFGGMMATARKTVCFQTVLIGPVTYFVETCQVSSRTETPSHTRNGTTHPRSRCRATPVANHLDMSAGRPGMVGDAAVLPGHEHPYGEMQEKHKPVPQTLSTSRPIDLFALGRVLRQLLSGGDGSDLVVCEARMASTGLPAR